MEITHLLDQLLPSQQPVVAVVVDIMDHNILQDNLVDLVVVMVLHLKTLVPEMREETIQDVLQHQREIMEVLPHQITMELAAEAQHRQDKEMVTVSDQAVLDHLSLLPLPHLQLEPPDQAQADTLQVAVVDQVLNQALVALVEVVLAEQMLLEVMALPTLAVAVVVLKHLRQIFSLVVMVELVLLSFHIRYNTHPTSCYKLVFGI
jgi:hypothetical protein